MKIVEYSKGSITEVENVFKVVESGAQGPQGEPGTIGTLDLLVNKPIVIPADLALVGDSTAAFANKYSTWQQLIDTVLSLFANNISDVNATALTDGGETALHSHAGGGGGSDWELIEDRAMTTNIAEVFNLGTDDKIKFEPEGYGWDGGSAIPYMAFSCDGGLTYPANHQSGGIQHRSGSGTLTGYNNSFSSFITLLNLSDKIDYNGKIEVSDLTTTNCRCTLSKCNVLTGGTQFTVYRVASSGLLRRSATPVDTVKFFNSTGQTINLGRIKLFKYVGD